MIRVPERRKQAIVVHPADNVATALTDLMEGSRLSVSLEQTESFVITRQPIPRGHKIAIRPITTGMPITKYGEQIGVATKSIDEGAHVHTHNVTTTRV